MARSAVAARASSSSTVSAAVAWAVCCAAAAVSCAGARSPGSSNPEQQSIAEYDVARDAFQNQRLREALEHVEKALSLDGENADAAYLGATVLIQFCAASERSSDCRYDEAERYARLALKNNPDMRDAKNTLGVILINEGKYDDAIGVLKPLANDILYGSPEKAWGNLGWAYLKRGSADEAIDALRRAVAAQPLFCVGQFRLGLAFEKKGDFAAARDALNKAIETPRPECQKLQDAHEALGRVFVKLDRRDDARAALEKCRDIASSTSIGQRCAARLQTFQ
jgi:Tfp pilus assembly protein PilF